MNANFERRKTLDNKILPVPFLASLHPNPATQDRRYLRVDGLRQYGYVSNCA